MQLDCRRNNREQVGQPTSFGSDRVRAGTLQPDGSIDTSFGNRGGVLTNFGSNPNATAFALAIQSNGEILAAGQAGSSLALSRYSSTGKLDTTFGSGGIVTTSLGSNPSAISSLALQGDGKIVAGSATFSVDSAGFHAQAAVARYLAQ